MNTIILAFILQYTSNTITKGKRQSKQKFTTIQRFPIIDKKYRNQETFLTCIAVVNNNKEENIHHYYHKILQNRSVLLF